MINADRVVSKAQILDHVWQYDFRGDMGIVETYVSYLRKKIDIYEPALIHTVRDVTSGPFSPCLTSTTKHLIRSPCLKTSPLTCSLGGTFPSTLPKLT